MDEDWEVVCSEDEGVAWVEVANNSRCQSPSLVPSTPTAPTDAHAAVVTVLEHRLREAQERAELAEARTLELRRELSAARQEVHSLQVVVQQQRTENSNLLAAALLVAPDTTPPKGSKRGAIACRDKRVSKAIQKTAPQAMVAPKRKAWGKANHRSSTSCNRHM